MGLPPGLDAKDIGPPVEIVQAFGRGPPAGLADGLAGLAAGRLRAISLVVEVARVRFVQLPAMAALTLSAWGHGLLRNDSSHVPPTAAPAHEENPTEEDPPTAQEDQETAEEDPLFLPFEEDPAEEDRTFKPADLPHYQNGGDK